MSQRTRVNASTLPKMNGRDVILLGAVEKINATGENVRVKTTDGSFVDVKLSTPLQENLEGVVEFHGISKGREMVADFYIAFPSDYTENFDVETYDQAVKIIHSVSDNPWLFD